VFILDQQHVGPNDWQSTGFHYGDRDCIMRIVVGSVIVVVVMVRISVRGCSPGTEDGQSQALNNGMFLVESHDLQQRRNSGLCSKRRVFGQDVQNPTQTHGQGFGIGTVRRHGVHQ